MKSNYCVNFDGDYIDRNSHKIKEVVFSKRLSCTPFEEYGAKLFHEYLMKHPNEDVNNLHCEIVVEEIEEDHYGNGGGYDHTFQIYKEREEIVREYDERVHHAEFLLVDSYMKALKCLTRQLSKYFNSDDSLKNKRLAELLTENYQNIVKEEIIDEN